MRPTTPRTWPVLAIASIVGAAGVVLWLIYQRPDDQRQPLLVFLGFSATIALPLVLTIVRWLWRRRTRFGNTARADEDELADRLAELVQQQWLRSAAEQQLLAPYPIPLQLEPTDLPVAGPLTAAIRTGGSGSALVDPIAGVAPLEPHRVRSISPSDLHAIYSTIASGRIIILGEAGSGKSTTAILLVLEALKHRQGLAPEDRPQVPVPVIIELAGWNPVGQTLETWVVQSLRRTYGLTGSEVTEELHQLVATGRLALVLDGFDELSALLRSAALRAMDEQSTYRVVLLSRPDEMVAASTRIHLSGAVALQLKRLPPGVVQEFILQSQVSPLPAGWRALHDGLHAAPESILSRALGTPLMLSLLRDTYSTVDRPDELLDDNVFDSVERIEKHLLRRVVPVAFERRPGVSPSRYSVEAAERALSFLAWQMAKDGTPDLAWWRISEWAPARRRSAVIGILFGLALGVIVGLGIGIGFGPRAGMRLGLLTALVAGLLAAIAATKSGPPRRLGRFQLRALLRKDALRREALVAVTLGVVSAVIFGVLGGLGWAVVVGTATALACGLGGLIAGVLGRSAGVESFQPALDPVHSWHDDSRYGIVAGMIAGCVAGLTFGLLFGMSDLVTLGPAEALESALAFGLPSAVLVGVIYSALTPRAVVTLAACWQLRHEQGTPLRMIRFLEEARALGVLRVVGPVYQFRHLRLQDHLAATFASQSRPN